MITREWIQKNYIEDTISVSALADRIGMHHESLRRVIVRNGFAIKPKSVVQSGKNNHFYGKKHTEETKKKMRGLRPHTAQEFNHNWSNDENNRGYLWHEYIRPAIVQRDGFKCTVCGSKSSLVVHHITPYHITKDNSRSNLVTMCNSCHISLHKTKHGRYKK